MSKNVSDLPFTEVVERAIELGRVREEVRGKVRGIVNDIYVRDIPQKEDWSFLMGRSTLTLTAEYTTGNATATTGGTSVTFDSSVTIESAFTGRRLKLSGNDYVYDLTFANTTGVTIQPPLSGTENATAVSYSIFRNTYPLASDFDRFPKNGGVHQFYSGSKKVIPEKDYGYYTKYFSSTPNENIDFCIMFGTDTAGNRLVELVPPPKNAISVEYDYIKRLRPLRETTAGLIGNVAASGTAVTGDSNTLFTEATTGDWFRIDAFGKGANSEWYKIINITNRSTMTLASAFGLSGATSAGYTICSAPQMPTPMHPALLYGTIAQVNADQDDPLATVYMQKYASVLSDGKRVYKTRSYQQDISTIAEDYLYRR